MSRVFVDTSAWFAFIRKDDPDHATCKELLSRKEHQRVTSNYVFDELMTLLRYRAGHATAVKTGAILRGATDLEIVRVQPEDEEEAWRWFSEHRDKDYSYTDCTSFALMRRLGLDTAVATDSHFRQAGFRAEPTI